MCARNAPRPFCMSYPSNIHKNPSRLECQCPLCLPIRDIHNTFHHIRGYVPPSPFPLFAPILVRHAEKPARAFLMYADMILKDD